MRAALLGGIAALALCACGPQSFFPGTRISGGPGGPVSDFAFASSEYAMQVEAADGGLFKVGNVRCLVVDGDLYLFSESYIDWPWMQALRRDPRARVRIAGKIYDARVTPLTDRAEMEALLPELLRKYYAVEVENPRLVGSTPRYPNTQVGVNFFRVEPAESSG